jgi:hypothetical protein
VKVYTFEGIGVAATQGMACTPGNTGASQVNTPGGSTITFDTAAAAQGNFGVKIVTSPTGACILRMPSDDPTSLTFQRTFEMKIPAPLPSGETPTFASWRWRDVALSEGTIMRLQLTPAGVLQIQRTSGALITLGSGYTAGQAIRVAVWGRVGTGSPSTNGELHVRVYTKNTTTVLGSHDSTNSDLGTNPCAAGDLGVGAAGTGTYTLYYDSDQWGTALAELPQLGNNVPPTVSVGSNVTLPASGGSVTLTATASDPDGSIASYLWTVASMLPAGTPPTIVNPTTANASVNVSVPGRYVFRCTVTDDLGATAYAEKKVFVPAQTVRPILDLANAGGWSLAGGATSAAAALADEDDNTFTQGPSAPPSEATQRILLAPMLVPSTSFALQLTNKFNSAGSATCKVRLYEAVITPAGAISSATMRKEWTVTPTTTAATTSLGLTSGEISSFTQWNEVFVEGSEL